MQKLNNIQAYTALTGTEAAVFAQAEGLTQPRLVKMRIISERDVVLKVTDCHVTPEHVNEDGEVVDAAYDVTGEPRLLAFVRAGFEEIEFYFNGSFVMSVDGEIMLDTFDNAFIMTQASDFENYAIARERPEVDPTVLEMQRIARHNQAEFDRQREADRAEFRALLAEAKGTQNVVQAPTDGNGGTPSGGEPKVPAAPPAANPPAVAPAPSGDSGEPDAGA